MTTQNMPYPVNVRGDLSIPPGRWVWLFKWLLLIPHMIVLFFLTIGAAFCWVVSLFAILFTGKYPRWAFDYNVGVMRWGWRVNFYGYQALGTDKYPPFSLEPDANYPADLTVAYPEKLSNGLVLVKWWLLAIPQLIIVGIFQGGNMGRGWERHPSGRDRTAVIEPVGVIVQQHLARLGRLNNVAGGFQADLLPLYRKA